MSRCYMNKPNLKPSEVLCYILGIVKGDGGVYHAKNGNWRVRLYTPNKVFAESFRDALQKIQLHPYISGPFIREGRQPSWEVVAYSILFVKWCRNLSITDLEAMFIAEKKYVTAFLKGLYESEGYASLNRPQVDITNTDKELVNLTERLLKRLGFHPHVYPYDSNDGIRKRRYQIRLYRREEVLRFLELIKPSIKNPLGACY